MPTQNSEAPPANTERLKAMEQRICRMQMTQQECLQMQLDLQPYISQKQTINIADIETIAGVDLAYWAQEGAEFAVCCIAVMDARTHSILARVHHMGAAAFPYIPGYLAFRELPLVLAAAGKLRAKPDVYMFDGNGILHPRKMGLAAQASIFLGIPALGVAKSYYRVSGADYQMPGENPGDSTDIVVSGEVRARALRTHRGVHPVFVSTGSYLTLDGATRIAMEAVGKESRIPIPTREADKDTRKWRAAYQQRRGTDEAQPFPAQGG